MGRVEESGRVTALLTYRNICGRDPSSFPYYRMLLRLYTVVVPSFDGLVMFYVPPLLENAGIRRLSDTPHLLKLTV